MYKSAAGFIQYLCEENYGSTINVDDPGVVRDIARCIDSTRKEFFPEWIELPFRISTLRNLQLLLKKVAKENKFLKTFSDDYTGMKTAVEYFGLEEMPLASFRKLLISLKIDFHRSWKGIPFKIERIEKIRRQFASENKHSNTMPENIIRFCSNHNIQNLPVGFVYFLL